MTTKKKTSEPEPEDPRVFPPELLERNMVEPEIRLNVQPWKSHKVQFLVLGRTIGPYDRQKYAVVTNLMLETVDEGEMFPGPTFELTRANCQGLMDELWRIGLRPSEVDSPGELRATKNHLADMRKLVASALDLSL